MRTLLVVALTMLGTVGGGASTVLAQPAALEPVLTVQVGVDPDCARPIDGFGTTAPPQLAGERWVEELYFGDLGASVLRVDLTPRFRAPVSDVAYSSPWVHGDPPLPGPDGNNVRSYRDLHDYTRAWGGRQPAIAVFGPDPEAELEKLEYRGAQVASAGALAQAGQRRAHAGEPFKLVGSIWSPAPWLKQSTGARFEGGGGAMPKNGTPWPFIWAGNFAGGKLDVSDTPRAELFDGVAETSALTQFVRITAAYVLGYQRAFGVRFYALSLQNELNFETFYNSCSYPDAASYVSALKALRRELDRHAELRAIKLMGPEDLIDSDPYALWQYGEGPAAVHKNLSYLAAIARDPLARAALSFFAVHAYSRDGVHGSGEDPKMWRWWLDGWSVPPASGLPVRAAGTHAFGKKSWMTESSGEASVWAPAAGKPLNDSALGLALKIHHALTSGEQSAWLYWHLLEGKPVGGETLTDASLRQHAPKYVAFKHFARFIRPDACALPIALHTLGAAPELSASAYRHARHGSTLVLINSGSAPQRVELHGFARKGQLLELYQSDEHALWRTRALRVLSEQPVFTLPARSLLTVRNQLARK